MIEIHGLRVGKLSAAGAPESQRVEVEDGPGYVVLRMDTSSYPAALSPKEARRLAYELGKSATRSANKPAREVGP